MSPTNDPRIVCASCEGPVPIGADLCDDCGVRFQLAATTAELNRWRELGEFDQVKAIIMDARS